MSTELESYYKNYIFKTHIAYTDEKCIERGVFATEDIKIGDILLKLPMTEVMKGTHVELTYALMDLDNEYYIIKYLKIYINVAYNLVVVIVKTFVCLSNNENVLELL